MTRLDDVVIGVSYAVLTTIFIVAYGVIVKVVCMDEEMRKQPTYRIIFHLGIAEIVGLFTQYSMAIFCIFSDTFHPWINKLFGAVLSGSWYTYVSLTTLLTLNRFTVLCLDENARITFKHFNTTLMIAATWLVGIADAGVYLSPLSTWIYVVSQYAYDRDWNQPWSTAMRTAEFWFSNANCAITAGLYFIIIAFLSIQALIISGYMVFMTYVYNFFDWFGVTQEKWCIIFIQFLWIFTGGLNPIIYLTMNRKIRRDFLIQFGIRTKRRATIANVTAMIHSKTQNLV